MFTGIIETTGIVQSCEGGKLRLARPWPKESLHIGQSISVNGCCLTIVRIERDQLEFDLSPETIDRTSFGKVTPGSVLNLERGMRLGDSIDGHLVSGHIDGVGTITRLEPVDSANVRWWVQYSAHARPWVVEKGSVALDGVSLTVNDTRDDLFSVMLIPHTLEITNFKHRKAGDRVNLEFDLVAKYVQRNLALQASAKGKTVNV